MRGTRGAIGGHKSLKNSAEKLWCFVASEEELHGAPVVRWQIHSSDAFFI